MRARAAAPWGAEIPETLFERYVLAPSMLSEPYEPWREELRRRVGPLVAGERDPGAAAVAVNDELWRLAGIAYNPLIPPDPATSPLASLAARRVNCVSASILLVAACRSLAIPARVVGIPAWAPGPDPLRPQRGYHQWVEVWTGSWRYLGAYDRGRLDDVNWFFLRAAATDVAQRRHRIHAAAGTPTARHFPLPWARADRSVPARDVTAFYTRRRTVRIELAAGRRAELSHEGEIVAVATPAVSEVVLAAGERFDWRLLDAGGAESARGSFTLADSPPPSLRLP